MYIHRVSGVGQVAYTDKAHALESHYQCQRIVAEWWDREVTSGNTGNRQNNGKGNPRGRHGTTRKRNRRRT